MQLAIHETKIKGFFSDRWIDYCNKNNINYKIVDCYSNTIIDDLFDCDGLLWHFSHAHPIDFQVAVKIIASIEASGKKTFPNFNSCWHFDDKVAQKYLLESINAPTIKSWVYYNKDEAFSVIDKMCYPKVFKLKGGAGAANVKLLKNKKEAIKYVKKSFGHGFRQFDRWALFKDAIAKYGKKDITIKKLALEFGKIFVKSDYEKVKGNENGYIYFQEFLPNNDFDIRIVVIGNRAFAIKRMVRENDFRASGSGQIYYKKENFDEESIRQAFKIAQKLETNCLAFDFLYNENKEPLIAEVSYGFFQDGYDDCVGYWDSDLNWFEGSFVPQHWMIEDMIKEIEK